MRNALATATAFVIVQMTDINPLLLWTPYREFFSNHAQAILIIWFAAMMSAEYLKASERVRQSVNV
jgi:hypothetical protein